jgi:hypothetical protein
MRNGSVVHGNETRRIQEVMSDFGVSELASDGSFDLPGGVPGMGTELEVEVLRGASW